MRFKTVLLLIAITVVLMLPGCLLAASNDAPAPASVAHISPTMPLSFEPTGTPDRYLARSGRYSMLIGPNESSVAITDSTSKTSRVFQFAFDKANPTASMEALDQLPGITNYYRGNDPKNWRLDVKHFAKVRTNQVYPGIDVVFYGDQRQLEFDFVVAPNADPKPIALNFSGTDKVYTKDGDLVAELAGESVRFVKPFAYQVIDGNRKPVSVEYALAAGKVQLRVGQYDKSRELIIDPVVTYATYLGGYQSDQINAVVTDTNGNAYVTGQTCSPQFPGSSVSNPTCSAFVSEISADGSTILRTTLISGNHNTWARSIKLDGSGNIYIVGGTNSTDLPANTNVTRWTSATPVTSAYFGGDSDAFIATVLPSGTLQRLAYLGGSATDDGFGVAIDNATPPNVIATGETCYSTYGLDEFPDFPAYSSAQVAFQRKVELCVGFITKLDNALNLYVQDPVNASWGDPPAQPAPAGGQFFFSEYFGGQPPNVATGGWRPGFTYHKGDIISVTYFVGGTPQSNAEKCIQSGISGLKEPQWSVSVNAVDNDGTVVWRNMGKPGPLINATTIPHGIATDPLGDIFVVGGSDSGFMGCDLCGDISYYVGSGAWIVKVDGNGGWVYSTVLGKTATDTAYGIAVNGNGEAYIAGTSSGGIFIPADATSFGSAPVGGQDAFVVKLDNRGTHIDYAGYVGGKGDDQAFGIAVDKSGSAYIVGSTKSSDFPVVNPLTNTTTNDPMNTVSGTQDAFIARIIPDGSVVSFASYLGGNDADSGLAVTSAQDGAYVLMGGSTHSFDFPIHQGNANASSVVQSSYNMNVDNDAGDAFLARIPIATLPSVSISPDPTTGVDFGSVNVGTTSAARTVTFLNTGNSPITITGVSTSGPFAIASAGTTCSTNTVLNTNQSCVAHITFTPTTGGQTQGSLTFTYNGTGSPKTVNLRGTGISTGGGHIVVTLANQPAPGTYTFQDQAQNTTSSPVVFTVTNTGDAAVTLNISLPTGAFALTQDPSDAANTCPLASSSLGSGLSCTVAVTFTPTVIGAAQPGTLSIAASSNTVTVTLQGTGTTNSGGGGGGGTTDIITSTTTSLSGAAGSTVNFKVSLAPAYLSGQTVEAVTLTCTPSNAGIACSMDHAILDKTTNTSNITLKITGAASGGKYASLNYGRNILLATILPFGLIGLTVIRRRKLGGVLVILVLLAMMIASVGCGKTSKAVSGGTYQVTVTGTTQSGTATNPVVVTLNVY